MSVYIWDTTEPRSCYGGSKIVVVASSVEAARHLAYQKFASERKEYLGDDWETDELFADERRKIVEDLSVEPEELSAGDVRVFGGVD